MPGIRFTAHLQRFFPELQQGVQVQGQTVAEVVAALERRYPGMADYLIDERGTLRKHVNIFIDDDLVTDRDQLSDRITDSHRIFIFQALSGG